MGDEEREPSPLDSCADSDVDPRAYKAFEKLYNESGAPFIDDEESMGVLMRRLIRLALSLNVLLYIGVCAVSNIHRLLMEHASFPEGTEWAWARIVGFDKLAKVVYDMEKEAIAYAKEWAPHLVLNISPGQAAPFGSANMCLYFKAVPITPKTCAERDAIVHNIMRTESRIHAKYPELAWMCPVCDRKYRGARALRWHIKTAHEGYRVTCVACGKKFTSTSGLRMHEAAIHKNLVHICPVCSERFLYQTGLYTHMLSAHKGYRWACPRPGCHQEFTHPSHLRRHELSVHQGHVYPCDRCDEVFSNPDHLRRHELSVHEGAVFRCDRCDKVFTDVSSLRKHEQAEHEGISYRCKRCGDEFRYKGAARSHLLHIHEVTSLTAANAAIQTVHKASSGSESDASDA